MMVIPDNLLFNQWDQPMCPLAAIILRKRE
jgi:hypothetical protein